MTTLQETRALAEELLSEHGLAGIGWSFAFDNAKRRGGATHFQTKHISMSRYLVPLWTDEQVRDTLIHEIAHALVGAAANHGPVWRRKMRELGAVPDRCHDNAVLPGRYILICDHCGREIGRVHRLSRYVRMGATLHAVCRTPVRWVDTQLARV